MIKYDNFIEKVIIFKHVRLLHVLFRDDACKRAIPSQLGIQPTVLHTVVLIVFLNWLLHYVLRKIPYVKMFIGI